jgi:hypothetical protein
LRDSLVDGVGAVGQLFFHDGLVNSLMGSGIWDYIEVARIGEGLEGSFGLVVW